MTKEEFEKLKVGDKVLHAFGSIGIVTEKDECGYVVKDKGFDVGDGMDEVSFAWNEGHIVKKSAKTQHVNETCKENGNSLTQEPVSEELEEAARKIATRHSHISGDTYYANDAWFFKKGAQWHKEQMMAKAIDAHCFGFQGDALFSFTLPADNYLVGSEVKVIIIEK